MWRSLASYLLRHPTLRSASTLLLRKVQERLAAREMAKFLEYDFELSVPGNQAHGGAIVLVDASSRPSYRQYVYDVRSMLYHLGVPYREIDVRSADLRAVPELRPSVLLIAQPGIFGTLGAEAAASILQSVAHGGGLVNLDHRIDRAPAACAAVLPWSPASARALRTRYIDISGNNGFVTKGLRGRYRLTHEIEMMPARPLDEGVGVVAESQGFPAVLCSSRGGGRVVQFLVSSRIWNEAIGGHCNRLCALFWRSLVWASRKPFVMKSMPSFVGIRIDDVQMRGGATYMPVLIDEEYRPFLGLFVDGLTEDHARLLAGYCTAGSASVCAHAFSHQESIYQHFDFARCREKSSEELEEAFSRVDRFVNHHGFKLARTVSPHGSILAANSLPWLIDHGIRFLNSEHLGTSRRRMVGNWLPYGRSSYKSCRVPGWPGAHSLVFEWPTQLEYDPKSEYDWLEGCTPYRGESPHLDVERIVERGTARLDSALNAKFPAYLTTHEERIECLDPLTLGKVLDHIGRCLQESGFQVVPQDFDHIMNYAMNSQSCAISGVTTSAGRTQVTLTGSSDCTLLLDVYTDDHELGVRCDWNPVPPFTGDVSVSIPNPCGDRVKSLEFAIESVAMDEGVLPMDRLGSRGALAVPRLEVPQRLYHEVRAYFETELQGVAGTGVDYERASRDALSPVRCCDQLDLMSSFAGRTPRRGEKLLEIGSGFGPFLVMASRAYGLSVSGVEVDPRCLDVSHRLLRANSISGTGLVRGVGERLPFPSNRFDWVYSSNVLEHVQDPRRVLFEGVRVLRVGGVLQFVIPNYGSFWEGHYGVFWLPGMGKLSAKRYLRILGRNPSYVDTLQFLTPLLLRRMIADLPNIEVLGWGEDLFAERLACANPLTWGLLDPVVPVVKFLQRVRLVAFAAWLSRRMEWFNPIILTLRKRETSK